MDQEEQSLKEFRREEKRVSEEANNEARSLERKKANLAREQAIEKDLEERRIRESEKRAAKETRRQLRDDERRKANIVREQAIAKDLEDRNVKVKNK